MTQPIFRAFVVGCTGETGKALVQILAKDERYSSVKLIQRRPTVLDYGPNSKDTENRFSQHVIDFKQLDKYKDVFGDTDICFCALGTTIKKSGKEQMRIIDHDYVLRIAELSAAGGCKEFHLVSSGGANANSLFFYLKLKGEIEHDLVAKNLSFEKIVIYRPAMLLCSREDSRPTERAFQFVLKLVANWQNRLSIPVSTLAQVMANAPFDLTRLPSSSNGNGVHILENVDIFNLASNNLEQSK